MNPFRRKEKAKEKWRARARMIDMRKTKVTLAPGAKQKRVPPWVYRKLVTKE
jgi:hypothetical protein